MSTENEGAAVPPAPSAPPVPVDAPAAPASQEHPAHEGGAAPTAPPPPVPNGTPANSNGTQPYAAPAASNGAQPSANGVQPPASPEPQQTADQPTADQQTAAQPIAHQGAANGAQPPAAQGSAPDASWPPPPPPGTPPYGDHGAAAGGAGFGAGGAGAGSGWGATYQQPAPKSGRGRGGLLAAVLVAALVAGGLGGGLGYTLAKNEDTTSSTTVSAADSGGDIKRDPGTVAGVAAKALPSTVTIQAESSSGEGGTGTGFVFDTEGHIVTNNHVVADAVDGGKLTATFPSGKKYDAEVIGHAQGYDVAVIKLKDAPSDLKPLTLGDSDKVAVGDSTIAIGAPFGLSNTVTTGIISAKNRPVASSDGTGSNASYMSALQTDASINPGNSGGPLLDAQGNVIGINSAIQSAANGLGGTSQSGSIGLGFAIPINQAEYVAKQLIKTGKPVYAKIGASVSLEDTTDGAKIIEQGAGGSDAVEAGGPAAKAGLKPGDVITKLDDRVIDSGPTLIGEIWTHKPGDRVTITYERDGQSRTVELTLGSRTGDS
ncbi:trypsin-like peptidase domain-containing protein [Streptomyces sp. ISL-22]|uniref:S1C family serine protease n=1 Tax=unclassified Streptomyces TaxID=2593676 RepID=UPI001BE67234|nr:MULTISPECIES: trypsin-like peptidase domain-containing protein [unclassified Streptomyces]MBT2419547.1 trypsin-like peptidase domain-containing protein [Streptomyces sp. ISL-24]MBT2433548.1 trypsin-like peptidase domain-containing protein [Streptomyces sp. ISL-22]